MCALQSWSNVLITGYKNAGPAQVGISGGKYMI